MRLKLPQPIGARGANALTKDSVLINCYKETLENGSSIIVKRPGVQELYNFGTGAGTARGMKYWQGQYVTVFGTTVRLGTTSIGTIAGTNPFTFVDVGVGTNHLYMYNGGTNAYFITGSTLNTVTNTNFTAEAPYQPTVASMDSYVFHINSNGRVFNSDLVVDTTTPQSWSALNFITAESEGDSGVAIARHINYVLAMKERSVEFFRNAAEPTGSPLAVIGGLKKEYGIVNGRTLTEIGGVLFFVGNSDKGYFLGKMESLRDDKISTKALGRILDSAVFTDAYASSFLYQDHTFYVLTLPTSNVTLVYDLKEGQWHRWADSSGNYWPYISADFGAGKIALQHLTNGKVVTIEPTVWRDDGSDYTMTVRTDFLDFGSPKYKFMARLQMLVDTGTAPIVCKYTDNDYGTYIGTRTLTNTRNYQDDAWGRFQRRAFEFTHTANEGMRLHALDMDVMEGTT